MRIRFFIFLLLFSKSYVSNYLSVIHVLQQASSSELKNDENMRSHVVSILSFLSSYIPTQKEAVIRWQNSGVSTLLKLSSTKVYVYIYIYLFYFILFIYNFKLQGFASWVLTSVFFSHKLFPFHKKNSGRIFVKFSLMTNFSSFCGGGGKSFQNLYIKTLGKKNSNCKLSSSRKTI